jgi:iron complex transport system permease protein
MKTSLKIALCCLACLACLLLAVGLGSVRVSPVEIVSILAGRLTGVKASIFLSIRLPRVTMAFLTGAALAVSGTVMQSVLRNPLASSYTLGVSSGASLFAAIVMLTGFSIPLVRGYTLPLMGFLGGLGTVLAAMGITRRLDGSLENQTIILTGMVISLFVSAMLTVVTALSAEHLKELVFWQMGSFSGQKFSNCAILAPVLALGVVVLTLHAREMDLMTFGEEQALSAGVDLKREKLLLIGLSTLLTGTAVPFVGVIGFIDLIAPHVVRRIFGSRHALAIPMSAVFGGGFMAVADLLSRTVLSPHELPVGAVTAIIGAPFFTYVYFRRRRETEKC